MSNLSNIQKAQICRELVETSQQLDNQLASQFCTRFATAAQFLEQIVSGALVVNTPKDKKSIKSRKPSKPGKK